MPNWGNLHLMEKVKTLAEGQIAKAQAEGKLTGLKGEGAPLPDRPIETSEQAAVFTGIRIMAEAGVLPEEFELKRQLDAARRAYVACKADAERKPLMARMAELELRYDIAREARRKFIG